MTLTTISPITNSAIIETPEVSAAEAAKRAERSAAAQREWARESLDARKAKVAKLLDLWENNADELGAKITEQMGRPIAYTPGEVRTAVARGRTMLEYADKALARVDVDPASRPQIEKYLTREPRGVALIVFPWNYPYLTLVNALVPALLAGNSALIKPSPQTPQVADAVEQYAAEAGLPKDLVIAVHTGDNDVVASLVRHPLVQAVSFTGSVAGGLAVQQAASKRTIPVTLELGGNDAAYVRDDVDIPAAADAVADGALFNSGQSCCSVERVYVHARVYDAFVAEVTRIVRAYKVGDPRKDGVQLGPLVSAAAAKRVRADVAAAVKSGARSLVPDTAAAEGLGDAYVSPQVLVDLPADSPILLEETFGPVLPIVKVESDEEAVRLINDSKYGLTASVWTKDTDKGDELAGQLDAGTVYVNRCDYPDPHLAWTGYRDSGRGVSLSPFGFDFWVRLKSHHNKLK